MRSMTRWLVPVAVAGTIFAGSAVSSAVARSAPSLPDRTPQQVLAAVAGSSVTALSGTVSTHAELGFPSLPSSLGGQGGAQQEGSATTPQALITRFLAGDNTVRVWIDGPQRQRARLVDPWANLDVVHDGNQLWTYDSRTNTVQHATVPADATAGRHRPGLPPTAPGGQDLRTVTPDQLATRVLAAVDPTTAVTLDAPTKVAGRDTYSLRITPRTTATLVDHVLVAVDAANGMPLQVSVFARGHAEAVLRSGFTSVDFARPDGSLFTFTPPKDATVRQLTLPSRPAHPKPDAGRTPAAKDARPEVIGNGWTTVVEFPAAAGGASVLADPKAAPLLRQLTTPVAGGRALRTALLTVLITDDGRVLAGAVPLQTLQDAAARR